MKAIDFDEVKSWWNPTTLNRTFRWYKQGQQVKELEVNDSDIFTSKYGHCSACLKYRAEIVFMSEKKTIEHEGQHYTVQKCPECKGIGNNECICGEAPHRIHCPMGFYNYFT